MNYSTYVYVNPHPKGKRVADCVKRAITLAAREKYQWEYLQVQRMLNKMKRHSGGSVYNSQQNWMMFVEEEGWTRMSFPAVKGKKRMNGHTFAETYKEGSYVLQMAGHLVACVDGAIMDTWDCRDKCVYTAYKVE